MGHIQVSLRECYDFAHNRNVRSDFVFLSQFIAGMAEEMKDWFLPECDRLNACGRFTSVVNGLLAFSENAG